MEKNPPTSRRPGFDPWVGKVPWRRKWQPTPVFLPGESHGRRSLAGYRPWDHKESDTTVWLCITTPHPHLSSKKAGWKAFSNLGILKAWAIHLFIWPCNKRFPVSKKKKGRELWTQTCIKENCCVTVKAETGRTLGRRVASPPALGKQKLLSQPPEGNNMPMPRARASLTSPKPWDIRFCCFSHPVSGTPYSSPEANATTTSQKSHIIAASTFRSLGVSHPRSSPGSRGGGLSLTSWKEDSQDLCTCLRTTTSSMEYLWNLIINSSL